MDEVRKALLKAWEAGWEAHEAFVASAPVDRTHPDIAAVKEFTSRASGLLLRKASSRMVEFGPHDARGAAIWDAGAWLDEHAMAEVAGDDGSATRAESDLPTTFSTAEGGCETHEGLATLIPTDDRSLRAGDVVRINGLVFRIEEPDSKGWDGHE